MSAMSAVGCGTPGQNCPLPIPRHGISAHLAAWQKQLSAYATDSKRAPELPMPSRQPSARGHFSAGELRSVSPTNSYDDARILISSNCKLHQCTWDLQPYTISSCSCSYCLLCSCSHSCLDAWEHARPALNLECVPILRSQPAILGMGQSHTDDAGSPSRQTPTGMAVQLVPQDRQASWDSHKWLAFTPPASLSSARLSRRVSQGLPGGARKLTQPDDSALRLPPLTPPGAEASNLTAFGSLPEASAMLLASGSATPTGRRSAGPLASRSATPTSRRSADPLASGFYSHPAGPLTASTQLNTLTASLCNQQAPLQQGKGFNSAQPVLHAAENAAICNELSSSNGGVCSGHEQVEANNVPVAAHVQEQQLLNGNPHGATSSVQPQRRHASTAGDDTGQLGPPITRMRPGPPPASSGSGGKKSVARQQAAADTAEAVLFDALLCGWEQQTNDGVSVMAVILIALVLAVLSSPPPPTTAPALHSNSRVMHGYTVFLSIKICQSNCQWVILGLTKYVGGNT